MFRFVSLLGWASLGLLAVGLLAGCGSQPGAGTSSSGTDKSPAASGGHDEIPAGLKELSPADRELALKQRICPVSGELLGSGDMGSPPKLTVEGREVFICCQGCEKALRKDPKKYFAKLDTPQP